MDLNLAPIISHSKYDTLVNEYGDEQMGDPSPENNTNCNQVEHIVSLFN